MSVQPLQQLEQKQETRALDPNVLQRRASDPDASVWVSASAGTGKTKVLTDRVLRLLLPGLDGRKATEPHRILCLTFTKAAANEMAIRINKVLSEWAVMPQEKLEEALEKLIGQKPDSSMMDEARKLFAEVVDTPGGLKILTIHSFCQSILGRFPLEAGLAPHFTVLDEALATEILNKSRDKIIASAFSDKESVAGQAMQNIASELNEVQFMERLKALCSERLQLKRTYDGIGGHEDLRASLWSMMGLQPDETVEIVLRAACDDSAMDKDGLLRALAALIDGKPTDTKRALKMEPFLVSTIDERIGLFDDYSRAFIKTGGGVFTKFATNDVIAVCPDCVETLSAEAERVLLVMDRLKAIKCASITCDMLTLGWEILQEYQELKSTMAVLDYDDLIDKTRELLESRPQWVMYKLDGGLDHMLIDEAQDTNPEQWSIVAALAEEFFAGYSSRDDVERTIFTVGDEKQSIYSFQRASPAEFQRMKEEFAQKVTAAGKHWRGDETLITSFRSTKAVLQLVDEVFSDPALGNSLGSANVEHESFRRGQEGIVELWPLFKTEKSEKDEPWTLPVTVTETSSGQTQLASSIAKQISEWIGKDALKSHGRVVEAGDIMILVRTRTAFVNQMVRALKKLGVPVSGVDRMVLGEQLAVMDLLALAQFALLPSDDLSLACVLKTPFLGWTEEELYEVAIDRKPLSLWQAVKKYGRVETIEFLEQLINRGRVDHPYEFFSRVLQQPCPADKVSGLRGMRKRLGDDALDPLEEFLNATLAFEFDHVPTLQGFLAWQQANDITIKRELDETSDHVRIMTVHGSKGLQAPIVILPDTTRTHQSKRTPRLLWPDKSGLDLPIWSPRVDSDANSYIAARMSVEAKLDEEYWRLLYVAMTRAEDRLYICGYEGKKGFIEDSWYTYIERAFERLDGVEEFAFDAERVGLRFSNPQIKDPDRNKGNDLSVFEVSANIEEPDWLRALPKPEAYPPRPLMPSRPSEAEPAMQSPLSSKEDQYRFKRGNITHKLLQILPDIDEGKRLKAARDFVAMPGHGLPDSVQEGIVKETMDVINHPEYGVLFGPNSMAEVPVTGMVSKNYLISGQIDRLLVTDDCVWIVDYKTNRPSPDSEKDIPAQYRAQMKAYSEAVAKIYPDREIKCFLLWTDSAHLMLVKGQ